MIKLLGCLSHTNPKHFGAYRGPDAFVVGTQAMPPVAVLGFARAAEPCKNKKTSEFFGLLLTHRKDWILRSMTPNYMRILIYHMLYVYIRCCVCVRSQRFYKHNRRDEGSIPSGKVTAESGISSSSSSSSEVTMSTVPMCFGGSRQNSQIEKCKHIDEEHAPGQKCFCIGIYIYIYIYMNIV